MIRVHAGNRISSLQATAAERKWRRHDTGAPCGGLKASASTASIDACDEQSFSDPLSILDAGGTSSDAIRCKFEAPFGYLLPMVQRLLTASDPAANCDCSNPTEIAASFSYTSLRCQPCAQTNDRYSSQR